MYKLTRIKEQLNARVQSGRIHGAVLDVFENEPLPKDSPLWTLGSDKLLLTPHCADRTDDYWANAAEIFVNNLALFRRGEQLRHIVDKEHGY